MQAHYRSVLDISNEAMLAAEKGFTRLMQAVESLNTLKTVQEEDAESQRFIADFKEKCDAALADDFNTPVLIAHLFEAVKFIAKLTSGEVGIGAAILEDLQKYLKVMVYDILGLKAVQVEKEQDAKLEETINILINLRNNARKNKNFELSDRIRQDLLNIGIELKDTREGTVFNLL